LKIDYKKKRGEKKWQIVVKKKRKTRLKLLWGVILLGYIIYIYNNPKYNNKFIVF